MADIKIDSKEIELLKKRLEEAGKSVNHAVDKALKASKQYVTSLLEKDTIKPNFPHQGTYSTGNLKNSINRDYNVKWQGSNAYIKVGYDNKKSGLTSILMIRGAPRKRPPMQKARKIKEDIYGTRTKREITKIQEETIFKIISRGM